eukprot:11199385-Lingulodinium_polyedra.AAC.1
MTPPPEVVIIDQGGGYRTGRVISVARALHHARTKVSFGCVWEISTLTPYARPRACRNVVSSHSPSCRMFAKYKWERPTRHRVA